jgi:hypothetical protein
MRKIALPLQSQKSSCFLANIGANSLKNDQGASYKLLVFNKLLVGA